MTIGQSVSSQLWRVLPIHDAELVSIEVVPLPNANVWLSLAFRLHPDESLDEVQKLGVTTRSLRLIFAKCWQVVSNVLGTGSTRETIDEWDIVEDSELLGRLKSCGFANGVELRHHRIKLSGGSCLDVLAEGVTLEEFGSKR